MTTGAEAVKAIDPGDQSPGFSHSRTLAKIRQFETLAAAVRSPRPMDAVIGLVLSQISEVVPVDAAAVWLHDSDNDLWYIGGARGLTRRASEVSFKGDQTLHGKIGDEGEIVRNLNSSGFRRLYPEHDLVRGALYGPMKIAGRRVGLIALYRNNEEPFTEDDLRFVRAVGSHVGMAVSFAALEARAEKLARLEERARLGADLHDGILQILSSVRLYTRELRDSLDRAESLAPDSARAVNVALARLEDCVDMGSDELAGAINHLRSPNSSLDVRHQLAVACDRLQACGITTKLVCDIGDISPEVSDALGWIVREAVSNVVKHSYANHVTIEAKNVGSDVELSIVDDGIAPNGSRDPYRCDDQHLGAQIMAERAGQIGGAVHVSHDGRGTAVRARLPSIPTSDQVPPRRTGSPD